MLEAQTKWNSKIQMVRGVAILFVVAFHFLNGPSIWGIYGVNLFFCTSGYLITGILLRDIKENGKIHFKKFALKRVRRLMPAASVTILFIMFLNFVGIFTGNRRDYIVSGTAYLIYIGNLVGLLPHDHHTTALAFGHLWTLSAEMQFYFLWSTIFINTLRKVTRRSRILITALLIILGIPLLQFALRSVTETIVTNTIDCLGSFLIGTFLYLIFESQFENTNNFFRATVAIVGGFSLLCIALQYHNEWVVRRGFFSIALSLLIASSFFLFLGSRERPWQRPLRHVGDISYSLYLIHYPVYLAFGEYSDSILNRILALGSSFILAECSYKFIEKRFWHPSNVMRAASGI